MSDLVIQKITPINSYKHAITNMAKHVEYQTNNQSTPYYSSYKKSKLVIAQELLQNQQFLFERCAAIHEKNIPLIEINKEIRKQVIDMMTGFGIAQTYTGTDPKSRARYPKTLTFEAGYKLDLNRLAITTDGYDEKIYLNNIKSLEAYIVELKNEEEFAKQKAARDEEERIKKRSNNLEYAKLILKYKLDVTYEWYDILDTILDSNKYLRLAHAGLSVRNNWNDGFDRVSYALFSTIDNEYDKEIIDAYDEVLSSEETDGRVFRDMKWNYSELFGLVPEDIMNDYNKCIEMIGEDEVFG